MRALRVAGMVGLVLLGMVMGGVVYGAINSLGTPSSSGDIGFYNGNEFRTESRVFKIGYVTGVTDAFAVLALERNEVQKDGGVASVETVEWNSMNEVEKWRAASADSLLRALFATSVPDGVTNHQLADIVDNYLRYHPAERQNSAALLVWRALAEAEWE